MKTAKRLSSRKMFLAIVLAVLCCLTVAVPAAAQQGDNVVWTSGTAKAPSSAFIDATAFCATAGSCTTSDDFCAVVNKALNTLALSGGVIDARGINSGASNTCAKSPFISPNTINTPSTVLLPTGTITISKGWVLPNGTKIIGQGAGYPGYSATAIAAASAFATGGTMIQMGPNSTNSPLTACSSATAGFCTEVSVEDLALQGGSNGANVSGIINGQSQDMSYVRRVSMYQIGGIGLKVWSNAQNSGPYSDITYDNGGVGSSSTECAEIDVSTRGLHGLFCKSESVTPSAAVIVDASNNSIKDVHILGTTTAGFTDGIQVKDTASSDVLFNVSGGTGVTNLIHLEKSGSTAAQDISIMSAASGGSTNTIEDSVTSTTLDDAYVGMYVLGVSGVGGSGYSRFTTSVTTSPNAVTWGVTSSSTFPSACAKGSLLSYTSSSSGSLNVCTVSGTWKSLP